MSGVNEAIVREYFESLGFVVSQPCKYVSSGRRKTAEEELDLIVFNPLAAKHKVPEALEWATSDLKNVARAVVAVRGWHTDRFYPSVFQQAPEILAFANDGPSRVAGEKLGSDKIAKILCLAELPASNELRKETINTLRKKGIDGVLVFKTMLEHLIEQVDRKKNYEKSDLLQVIRIFKSHKLLKDNQMELFSKGRKKKTRPNA